ncbi:hypothetical protein [Sandaracinus amylolyticus]|uniref:hypothetical protein n=1 Tax=Sandaracinus amylolyticus TaxID=927083 RepID=UPI0012EDEB71|nr:hypothetical protein [Sandaracinus amylolyticus]
MISTVTRLTLLSIVLALFGCGNEGPSGLPVLGAGEHTSAAVEILTVVGPDVLHSPTDLAFRPDAPNELWVTMRTANAILVIDEPGTPAQRSMEYAALGNTHFLPAPSALAFGTADRLATIHEIDVPTQRETPWDFMGPTLWPTDRGLFDGGHASHMDMLHNTPNGIGIAWEQGNVYWIVDGQHGSITRYDFVADHGPGQHDHSDGIISRYAEGQIGYVEGVPAHAELDHATGLLYVADPGNHRVVALDIASGTRGAEMGPNYDGCEMFVMNDATLTTFVDGTVMNLVQPSGIALHDGYLFVSDHATSVIAAFDLVTGALVDWIGLQDVVPPGGLGGIDFDQEGRLFVTDIAGQRVLRIAPRL